MNSPASKAPDLLTVDEVAVYLRVSPKTIYRLLQSRGIPAARIGRHWRFDRRVISNWVSRKSLEHTRKAA